MFFLSKIWPLDIGTGRLLKSVLFLFYIFSALYTFHLFSSSYQYSRELVRIVTEEKGKFLPASSFYGFKENSFSGQVVNENGEQALNIVITPRDQKEFNGFGFNVDMAVPLNSFLVLRLKNNSAEKQVFINITDGSPGGELFSKSIVLKPSALNEFHIPLKEFQRNEWQPPGASLDGQFNTNGIVSIAVSVNPGYPLDINLLSIGFEWGLNTVSFSLYYLFFLFTGLFLLWRKLPEESGNSLALAHWLNLFIYFCCIAIGFYFIKNPVFRTDPFCYIAFFIVFVILILDEILFFRGLFAEIWALRYVFASSLVYYIKSDDPNWTFPLLLFTILYHVPFLLTLRLPLLFLSFLGPLLLIAIKGAGNIQPVMHSIYALVGGCVISYFFLFVQKNRRDRLEAEHKDQLIKGILETSSDGILLLDSQGNILSSNAGFMKMMTLSEQDIVGLKLQNFISQAPGEVSLLHDGEFDCRLVGTDNKTLFVFLRIHNLYKGAERKGIIVTISDITERKKLEERLRTLSIVDNLTGLYNRRHFDEKLEEEWNRASRNHSSLTLLLLDVDQFKLYNDTYGHIQGDVALQKIASVLGSSSNRPSDRAFRYGGEEFAILLPETLEDKLPQYLANIMKGIELLSIPHAKSQVANSVTVSIGCKTIIPDKTNSLVDLIRTADKALYQAKAQGRNRYVISQ